MTDGQEPHKLEVALITGLSGAGKSEAVATFEDAGYFCIDNLPPQMLPNMVELFVLEGSRVSRAAVVLDARGGRYFEHLDRALDLLRDSQVAVRVVYLEATEEALVARYQATRRPHPLSLDLLEGIARERELLAPLRAQADVIIDTTGLSPWDLRRRLEETLLAERLSDQLLVSVESFGYRYGLPDAADMVLDVRFLPNPHWVPELRPHTGLDPAVREFVLGQADGSAFVERIIELIRFMTPGFLAEQKRRLVLALGCTGGRHRSVALAEELSRRLRDDPSFVVNLHHRDVDRTG